MSLLSVGSFGEVGVVAGGAQRAIDHGGDVAESYSRKLRTDSPGARSVWRFTTDLMPVADANSLVAELDPSSPVSVSGDLIGGTVSVLARNVTIDHGPLETPHSTVSFELWQVSP